MGKLSAIFCIGIFTLSAQAEPPVLPTLEQASQVFIDDFWNMVRNGKLDIPIKNVERIDTANIVCTALGNSPDANIVCGTEVRLYGEGKTHRVQSSPTLRKRTDGQWELLLVEPSDAANSASVIPYPKFICAHEEDHLPPLDNEADAWYRKALVLTKRQSELRGNVRFEILDLYNKAVERDHWKAMHNLAALYRTGWPGALEEDTDRALELYERMVELQIPQGFYDMAAMMGNSNGLTNPATDGLTYLDRAAQLGNPAAQVELGKIYIFELNEDELGLKYYQCAAEQNYASAYYRLGSYYWSVKNNFPQATKNFQIAASLGHDVAAMRLETVFDKDTPPDLALWYLPDDKLKALYHSIYMQLEADPDARFPNLVKDHPLPPHPTQGYDAEHPDRRPEL